MWDVGNPFERLVLTDTLFRGSGLLSRFHTWHSQFLVATVFIAVGYIEPTGAPMKLGGPVLTPNLQYLLIPMNF